MQVEPDFNGLRNGSYGSYWGYHESNQMDHDSLPEKIYSMVSQLVDEDSEVDIKHSIPQTQKNQVSSGFYDGTHTWSDVPISTNASLSFRPNSPLTDPTKQMIFDGLEQLDFSHNMLDLSFLTRFDEFNGASNKIGENMDSGFASPADKIGCITGTVLNSEDDGWDWEQLSKSLDPHSNHNYINLLAHNPELLDQIVRGDASIDPILNDRGLMPMNFLPSPDQRQPYVIPHASPDTPNNTGRMDFVSLSAVHPPSSCSGGVQTNMRPAVVVNGELPSSTQHEAYQPNASLSVQNLSLVGKANGNQTADPVHSQSSIVVSSSNSHVSAPTTLPLEKFSPYRPPPELPYTNVNGPLGFNNNNEYRSYGPEHNCNGFNMHLPGKDVPVRLGDHDGRTGDWPAMKATPHFNNGLVALGNGGVHHPGSLSGPFRSPPPFMSPNRLPVYPPPMDHAPAAPAGPAQLYPLPCFQRHHLFPFPAPIYNFRQMRRNPIRDELSARLDQCYEQFRQLEKERKKTEADLARHNPGKKLSSANSMTVPRLPPNPTRVDRLVVDQLREHARVVTLVGKMERLRGNPFGSDVHLSLSVWDDAIRKVQALRQDEIRCRSRIALEPAEHRAHHEEKGIGALAAGIHDLSVASRQARTSLWACLMVTLAVPSTNSTTVAAAATTNQ